MFFDLLVHCVFVCLFVRLFILGLSNCTVSPSDLLWWLFFAAWAKLCHKFQMLFSFSLSIWFARFLIFSYCTQSVCVCMRLYSIFRIHSDILSCGWHFFECSINNNSNIINNTTRVNNTLHLALWTLLALAMEYMWSFFQSFFLGKFSFFLIFLFLSQRVKLWWLDWFEPTNWNEKRNKKHHSTKKNFLRMFIIIFARLCICILWFLAWCTLYSFTKAHHTSHTYTHAIHVKWILNLE